MAHGFAFFAGAVQFMPGDGTTIRYVSKGTDVLTLTDLPAGTLAAGNEVTVKYRPRAGAAWTVVFRGSVARIRDAYARGDERVQTVECEGPWGAMNRLVFRQSWKSGALTVQSPRVILNQSILGEAMTLTQQVREICDFAAAKCGFSVGSVDAGTIQLPLDETRDMTCASALLRELRFFPKKVVRFDYAAAGAPALVIAEPDTSTAAEYVADVPKTSIVREYNAHPITAVDVYTDGWQVSGSAAADRVWAMSHQVWPTGADTDGVDVLHAYIPLAKGSASTTWQKLESRTTEIPANLNQAAWWKAKHPRLANVALAAITITDGARTPSSSPRIAENTAAELEAAGLHSEVSRFSCKCTIRTADDEEENLVLTMDFLTTDATTRTYTWQTGSSSTAGESLPSGLAKAIYEQRSGELLNERMVVRLGDALPQLGDCADGLILQDYTVDCADLTAELHFGQPEHLSVEDMRDLLTAFRQRAYASNAVVRPGGEDAEDEADDVGAFKPIAASEWSPGSKVKTTIKSATGGGAILLDSTQVGDGKTVGVHTLSWTDGQGAAQTAKVLATADVTIPTASTAPDTVAVVTGVDFSWDENGQLVATLTKENVKVKSAGAAAAAVKGVGLWRESFVVGAKYDSATHKFTVKSAGSVKTTSGTTDRNGHVVDGEVFTAVQHTPGMDG